MGLPNTLCALVVYIWFPYLETHSICVLLRGEISFDLKIQFLYKLGKAAQSKMGDQGFRAVSQTAQNKHQGDSSAHGKVNTVILDQPQCGFASGSHPCICPT